MLVLVGWNSSAWSWWKLGWYLRGRNFYIPLQRGVCKDEYPMENKHSPNCKGSRDQADTSPVFLSLKKGELWMPWSWQSTRWSYFTLVKHFQNEHLCEQCCFQQDKAWSKNAWLIAFKNMARKPHKIYCFSDPLIIPDFISSPCQPGRLKISSVWLSIYLF